MTDSTSDPVRKDNGPTDTPEPRPANDPAPELASDDDAFDMDDMDDDTLEVGEAEAEAAEFSAEAERIDELEAEIAALKDQQLRSLADAENTRRRAQRDRDEQKKYGATALARDVLSVADNLRRALDAVPPAKKTEDAAFRSLAEGVEMVERELLASFERHGVKRIEPLGEKFDHNHHQAMLEIETAEVPRGHVAQVLQAGYVLHDRLLRPALVGVAKAPAGAAPASGGGDKGGPAPGSTIDTKA